MARHLPLPILPSSIRWSFVLAAGAAIFYYSVFAVAPDHTSSSSVTIPYFQHFLAYFALGTTLGYASVNRPESHLARALVVVVAVATYGTIIEIVQAFTVVRTFAFADVVVNTLAGLASTAWFVYERRGRPIDVGTTLREWLDRSIE